GNYAVNAVATDNLGTATTSTPITVNVNSSPIASGQLLNINFGSGSKVGFAATGLSTNDQWNLVDGSSTTATNFVLANAGSSSVGLTITGAAGTGANNSGDAMYDSYLYSSNSTAGSITAAGAYLTVTLSGVQPGRYDLFLYGHADPLPGLENDTEFVVGAGNR